MPQWRCLQGEFTIFVRRFRTDDSVRNVRTEKHESLLLYGNYTEGLQVPFCRIVSNARNQFLVVFPVVVLLSLCTSEVTLMMKPGALNTNMKHSFSPVDSVT